MRALALALVLTVVPAAAHAQVSVRDIVELTKAGLGEEVLLALIEVHRPVFPVDPATLKTLKDAGVPQAVIVAMVKSGREPLPEPAPIYVEPPPAPAPPPPQVVVVEREPRYEQPRIREVAVPVYVPVPVHRVHPTPRPPVKPAEPVYWGWGGKLRPDAWKPTQTTVQDIQPDAKVPPPQKR